MATMANLKSVVFFTLLVCGFGLPVKESTLLQLHVVFRHGDRAPDKLSMYPKDPYINDTWYPEGLGGLTLTGKMQEYDIGKSLRKKYNKFLGKIYTPDILDAWSTDYNRTKMSCELALAGLFPPAPLQDWNNELPWQPIPYNYLPSAQDRILGFPLLNCPNYQVQYATNQELPKFKNFLTNNADLIQYLNENSGLNAKTTLDLFIFYFGLYAEEQTGRVLPAWTQKIFPEFLESATVLNYELQTYTDSMLQSSGGYLVQKIITDAKNKINGTLIPKDRKIWLYSGHEYNVAHTLAALHVFKPHVPNYGSYVVVELHRIHGVYGLQVLHQNYEQEQPILLTIPGCESFCPLDKFVELTAGVMPRPNSC